MAIVAVVLFVITCLMLFFRPRIRLQDHEEQENVKFTVKVCALINASIAGILIVLSSFCIVKPENVGVQVFFGSMHKTPLKSGFHVVCPFSDVEQMTAQGQNFALKHDKVLDDKEKTKVDDSVGVRSSNGLQMPIDVTVPYRLIPEAAPWVYKNLGVTYVDKVMRVCLPTALRRAAVSYTSEELYSTKREEFADKTKEILFDELNKYFKDNYKNEKEPLPDAVFSINQVLIGHVGLPETVKNAIENKLKSDQEQQAMEFAILKEEKEAKRKKVEAEGIQQFQEIVVKGITKDLLAWKGIEATLHLAASNNAKIIVIGSGSNGLPLILNGDSK